MAAKATASKTATSKTMMQRFLDGVERVGNLVPHPVVVFLILIGIVIVLSVVLSWIGVSVTIDQIDPATDKVEQITAPVKSLLSIEGIRFLYVSLIPNFMSFTAVGLLIVVMIGAGVMEESGLVRAAIRKVVAISPANALSYILAFIGILASVAADAGYLVLLPLAGAAFLSANRHPIAGLALAYAAVAGAFTVNMLIKPLDAILVTFTNDAIGLIDPTKTIGLASNIWFSIASVIVLTIVIGLLTDRVVSPRLGEYAGASAGAGKENEGPVLTAEESRGLRYAGIGLLVLVAVFLVLTIPSWAPLRDPETGALIGNSPFMNGLIVLITLIFLVTGWCFGIGAGTTRTLGDVIAAMEKAVTSLGGTILLFFVISQFTAYFTYTNLGMVLAFGLADGLRALNLGVLPLLLGFIIIVLLLDTVIVAAVAKWAIFAPIFVPLLLQLGADPAAVLAAYRVGDSPMNALTPVNAYFALVVGFAREYDKKAGVGTVVALMLPYFGWITVVWMVLFSIWEFLGLPWGV
jgi:aminobenzoyl-glutamate transport protein